MTPCPPDDVLGALVQRVLPDAESEVVRTHIDECEMCAQAMIAAVRGRAIDTGAAPTLALGTPNMSPRIKLSEPPRVGSKIGRYELRALLGAGGMGHVYEAYDGELDRAIALKVLRPELAVAQALADRLLRESRLMAKVVHPSVITVYDVGREGDTVFIAMELIRGETLGAYVRREKRDWRTIIELFERAGAGLAAAHRAGIVHRDFKPDNVLVEVTADHVTRVVVTDFGIARATSMVDDVDASVIVRGSDPRMTATGAAMGTPAYMAPEQLGGAAVDLRADVFAFAVSIWEALFEARPFPGDTVEDIRVSMMKTLRAPFGLVPRGLVRVIERGLAIDPRDRWQDMTTFVRELTKLRLRRRHVRIAAGIARLVALGSTAAVLIARPAIDDPCSHAKLEYDEKALASAIDDAKVRDTVVKAVATNVRAWRETHRSTCKADRRPAQSSTTTACLEARKIELTGYVADVIADHGTFALQYGGVLGDPTKCAAPPQSLLTAKIPADPVVRRQVTALRYRGFAAEVLRDKADFKTALAEAQKLVVDTEHAWPLVHAEALYFLGTVQSLGGDSKAAIPVLRKAAAIAETAHHDYIAANCWIQLVISSTFDEGTPERGLEYATYAKAAIDRLGQPHLLMTMYEYARGTTLVELDRIDEAEQALRHSVELAEKYVPDQLPQSIQGLGYLYEQQGRFREAVDAYRRALEKLPNTGSGVMSGMIVFRQRLAINLSLLGQLEEAEAESRRAVELAEQALPPEHSDHAEARANLAQVLHTAGKLDEALTETRRALVQIAKVKGDRNERYGEVLQLEGTILSDLERYSEAVPKFERACDIIAFQSGEKASPLAQCYLSECVALSGLGKNKEALALIEKALPILSRAFGEPHPEVANAFVTRGALHAELGHHAAAIADLEHAIEIFSKAQIESGHLAGAEWALAKELWHSDPPRARALLEKALKHFDTATGGWAQTRADAAEWLATNGKPKRH